MGCSKCIRSGYNFCKSDPNLPGLCIRMGNNTELRRLSHAGYTCSATTDIDNSRAVYDVCNDEYKE